MLRPPAVFFTSPTAELELNDVLSRRESAMKFERKVVKSKGAFRLRASMRVNARKSMCINNAV
jgi:hypothetical protein